MYEESFGMVYRVAYRFSGSREAAEDAAQEAFARAYARWRLLQGRPWVVGWIMTTTLNLLRRAGRSREAATVPDDRAYLDPDPDAALDLWAAVRGLPKRQAEAVVLHHLVDLPVAQVAEVMRCREGTAKAHLDRARRRLAEILEPADVHQEE